MKSNWLEMCASNIRAWELNGDDGEHQAHALAEPIGVEEVVEYFFGKY
jgi:hypothetical protein